MMRKLIIIFSVALIGLFLMGCFATHSGTMVSSASLSQNNFKIIGNVTGQAETYTFLLFGGGLGRDALVNEAKHNLRPLRNGQAYANITVDFYNAYYVLVTQTRCTINADVVQFLEDKYNKIDTLETVRKDSLTNMYERKYGFMIYEHVDFFNEYTGSIDDGKIIELYEKGASIQTSTKKDDRFFVSYDKIKKKK